MLGHHEGGGLTVEVTKPDEDGEAEAEAEVKREVQGPML
jgi:hypothetical protein